MPTPLPTEVRVARCDAAEPCGARWLITQAQAGLPPLRGVYHAAGVLADGLLPSQTSQALRHVYAPKAVAATWLQLATSTAPLRAFLLFSSTSALLGAAVPTAETADVAGSEFLLPIGAVISVGAMTSNWRFATPPAGANEGVGTETCCACGSVFSSAFVFFTVGLAHKATRFGGTRMMSSCRRPLSAP